MAELTPERASQVREKLKRLMKREARNTRRLREVLEQLTELAEEREDIDHAVGDIVWSELSDDQDAEMVELAIGGLDMDQLFTIIGRSSRPKNQLQAIVSRFKIIRDMRVHGRGREENAERNREHIILGAGGSGGSGGGGSGSGGGSYITETISWPGGGSASRSTRGE